MRKKSNKSTILFIILCTTLCLFNFYPIQNLKNNPLPEETTVILEQTIVETTTQAETTTTPIEESTTGAQETTTIKQKEKKLPSNFGAFKSYTDYRCLSRSSAQWKLQEQAYTDENGLRKIDDAYLVALGSYYGTKLGVRYTVTLSTGNQFGIILCDSKDDRHTNETHQYTLSNNCVIEFYVETEALPKKVRQSGSISAIEGFEGSIVSIEKTAE